MDRRRPPPQKRVPSTPPPSYARPRKTRPVCLAFDPWTEGKPSVYAYRAWDAKEAGARIPAEYFLHGLPEKAPTP